MFSLSGLAHWQTSNSFMWTEDLPIGMDGEIESRESILLVCLQDDDFKLFYTNRVALSSN